MLSKGHFQIPLGTVLRDTKWGQRWVYTGYRESKTNGHREHYFVIAEQDRKAVAYTHRVFHAVRLETITKRFPELPYSRITPEVERKLRQDREVGHV